MKFIFNQPKIPRTTTRAKWKEIWRWKRSTQKRLEDHNARMTAQLSDPDLSPEVRGDIINQLINPPVVVFPNESNQHRRN